MVMAELDGEGYEAIRADVEEIRKASQKAAALTRQLLAFSRRQVLQPRELNLNDVIDALQKMLRRVIGEDVQLDVDLHGELPPVFADPGQIEQVLLSLVLNSRDAMPAGGRLAISSANVQVEGGQRGRWSDAAPGEYAEVTVSDSGVGIPSNILPHIFEPFFSTKERSSHAGLGLSTVYGIVSQSGGFLSVESAEGMGAVLRILLPSHTPPLGKEAIAESSRVQSQQGGKTILLVEDEPGVRNVARRVLEGSGFSILEAASGDEALDIFAANAGRVDLVVTDIVMPGMNGRTFVRKLEEQKGAVMPRVLYMSGYSEDDIVRQDLLVADVAFLEKPFSMQSLLSAVQKSLQ
jgi:CheY-like chemotaxis protein